MSEQEKVKFDFYIKLIEEQKRLFDILRESNSYLWNSLLSFDAIIITVFTGFLALNQSGNKTLLFIIIFISIASALLLIFNFKSTKNFYTNFARDFSAIVYKIENNNIYDEKDNKRKIKKGEDIHRLVECFENISIGLILLELLLIIFFLSNI